MRELRDKPRALPLFRRLDYDQVPRAVAGGAARGTVYVDSLAEPALALLWDDECHDTPFPGGESYRQAAERIRSFLEELRGTYQSGTVLIIGHRATQYALQPVLEGVPLKQAVTAPWRWQPGWTYLLR